MGRLGGLVERKTGEKEAPVDEEVGWRESRERGREREREREREGERERDWREAMVKRSREEEELLSY